MATCPDAKHRDGRKAVELATRACELNEADYAEAGDFDKAVEWQEKANKLYSDADDRKKGEDRLKLYQQRKPYREEDK